jgi:O-antigen/teichoic acid export membrane protein
VAFAATIYIARVLGAEGYGVIAFATAVVLYISRIADAGADLGLGVREIAAHPHDADRLASAFIALRLPLSIALAALTAAVAIPLLPSPDDYVLALYGLTLVAAGLSTRWVHLGHERAGRVAVARVIGEGTMVVLVLLFVHGREDITRVPLAQLAGELLASALLLAWLRRAGHRVGVRADWPLVRPLMDRASRLVVSTMLGLVIYNADFIFLRFMRGSETVGYYAAAYALISFLSNLGIAYGLSLLPTLTRLATDPRQQRELYHTASAHVVAAGLPVVLGGFLLAPQIIRLMFGSEYAPASVALQVLIWSIPIALIRDVPVIALMASGREDQVLRTTGFSAVANLALNAALIPKLGMVGAAAATVLTEIVRMTLAMRYGSRLGFGVTPPVRYWRSLLAGVAMAVAVLLLPGDSLLLSVLVGATVYVAALAAVGGLRLRRGALPELTV